MYEEELVSSWYVDAEFLRGGVENTNGLVCEDGGNGEDDIERAGVVVDSC